MRRRTLLGAVGTAAAAASAGCISGLASGGTGNHSGNASEGERTVAARWLVGTRADVERPADNRPHHVVVRNATPTPRTVAVTVTNRHDDERVLAESVKLPADGAAVAELLSPATYDVTVEDGLTGRSTAFAVTRDWFDCNRSSTTATLEVLGGATVTFGSTLVYCGADGSSGGDERSGSGVRR